MLITIQLQDKERKEEFENYVIRKNGIVKRRAEFNDMFVYDIETDHDNVIPILTKSQGINFDLRVKENQKRMERFLIINIILWTLVLLTSIFL